MRVLGSAHPIAPIIPTAPIIPIPRTLNALNKLQPPHHKKVDNLIDCSFFLLSLSSEYSGQGVIPYRR